MKLVRLKRQNFCLPSPSKKNKAWRKLSSCFEPFYHQRNGFCWLSGCKRVRRRRVSSLYLAFLVHLEVWVQKHGRESVISQRIADFRRLKNKAKTSRNNQGKYLKFWGPDYTYSFLFKNGEFSLQFKLPSTRSRWKRSPKTHLFKNALHSEDFEKAGHSFTCGRMKTVMLYILLCYTYY